jgi:hypothetical protein
MGSVADPRCFSRIQIFIISEIFPFRIPDPNFFHPGSRIRIEEFNYLNPKNRIRVVRVKINGSRIRIRNTDLTADCAVIPAYAQCR